MKDVREKRRRIYLTHRSELEKKVPKMLVAVSSVSGEITVGDTSDDEIGILREAPSQDLDRRHTAELPL